jgi:putative transcriptional regulator
MSKVGKDLVEAFDEMAGYLRGEVEVESYELQLDVLTPRRIGAIRRSLASSTKTFEAEFHIPARTIESYEQGRRKPDVMAALLLRILEKDPDAVRRAAQRSSLL